MHHLIILGDCAEPDEVLRATCDDDTVDERIFRKLWTQNDWGMMYPWCFMESKNFTNMKIGVRYFPAFFFGLYSVSQQWWSCSIYEKILKAVVVRNWCLAIFKHEWVYQPESIFVDGQSIVATTIIILHFHYIGVSISKCNLGTNQRDQLHFDVTSARLSWSDFIY